MESSALYSLSQPEQNAELAREARIYTLAVEISKIKAVLEAIKPFYDALDLSTLELNSLLGDVGSKEVMIAEEQITVFNGQPVIIPPQFIQVVDNFAEKNTVFRVAAVKRFEAKIELIEERIQKEAKALKKATKSITEKA